MGSKAEPDKLRPISVGCEGFELHTYTWPHMDSIDLDPQPILGIGSDIY